MKHNWYIYLCYNKLFYTATWNFPYEHLAKYGRVTLSDLNTSYKYGGVVIKPRNICFIPIKLTRVQIEYLITILYNQNWSKNALCDVDINDYPEILI